MANQNKDRALPSNPEALKKLQRDKMFSYEGGDGKFFAPVTVAELADIYAQYPTATILAGGTDVGLWVTKFHMDLPVLIYTGNIAELKQVKETAEGLEIGGAASYTDAFAALAAYGPTMEDMLKRFASIHLRNVGTVGGNIANGSPIGDGPPPLIALAAKLVLRSKAGSRTINLEDFFIAYKKQDRKPGEFVEKIIVPKKAASTQFRVYKNSKRFDEDISAVCAAFAFDIQNGKVISARIAFGGMAGTPKRATNAEKILTGATWDWPTVQKAMAAIDTDYQPMTDARASAKYRSDVARNLLRRFYIETTEPETQTQVYRYAE